MSKFFDLKMKKILTMLTSQAATPSLSISAASLILKGPAGTVIKSLV